MQSVLLYRVSLLDSEAEASPDSSRSYEVSVATPDSPPLMLYLIVTIATEQRLRISQIMTHNKSNWARRELRILRFISLSCALCLGV